jgi:hypothetical protein
VLDLLGGCAEGSRQVAAVGRAMKEMIAPGMKRHVDVGP